MFLISKTKVSITTVGVPSSYSVFTRIFYIYEEALESLDPVVEVIGMVGVIFSYLFITIYIYICVCVYVICVCVCV